MTRSDRIEIRRIRGADAPLDPDAPRWREAAVSRVGLQPSPLPLVAGVSPYLAHGSGHGRVHQVHVRALHDGESLAIRLEWADATRDDRIDELDRFVDAAAVMFPLSQAAQALTMGSAEDPVNMWLWRADRAEPFDVIARGYSTSRRRPGAESGLAARAHHSGRGWSLVFHRPLAPAGGGAERVALEAGGRTGLAFAIWDGASAERAGQKSTSAAFLPSELMA